MENVTRIGDIDPADAGRWTALGRLLVPYGGLLAGDLQAGEILVVNGATGGFGSAGVAVALAMGAGAGGRHGPQRAGVTVTWAAAWAPACDRSG